MLCPNIIDEISDFYRLKNFYENYDDRISFSLEIVACTEEDYCADINEIETFLSKIYVTEYLLQSKFDRSNSEDHTRIMFKLSS